MAVARDGAHPLSLFPTPFLPSLFFCLPLSVVQVFRWSFPRGITPAVEDGMGKCPVGNGIRTPALPCPPAFFPPRAAGGGGGGRGYTYYE